MKKWLIAGASVLVLGVGGWAMAQAMGWTPLGQDPSAEEEDEVVGFADPRRPGETGDDSGIDDGGGTPPTIHDGEVSPTGAIAMPHLRPGMWEVTNSNSPGLVSTTCLDMAIQEEVNIYGGQLHAPFCQSAPQVRREGAERWTYANICVIPDIMTMRIDGVIEGDLRTRYTHTMNTHSSGAMGVSDSSSTTEQGRWAGPCPANMASGDILMNGAPFMNMRQAMALGQAMLPGAFGGMPEGFTPAPD